VMPLEHGSPIGNHALLNIAKVWLLIHQ